MGKAQNPTHPTSVPRLFDADLLALRQRRALRRRDRRGESFLMKRMVDDLAERLEDVNRRFASLLLIAPEGADRLLRERLPAHALPHAITLATPGAHTRLPHAPASFESCAALVGPGQVDDLPGALIEMRRLLRPDGLLLAAWFGGQTLAELRGALYALDEARLGGATPRVHPGVDHVQAAQLLARAGLALPVVDRDRFTVRYRSLRTLVEDLRDLGLGNALAARARGFLGRDAYARLQSHMSVEAGRYPVTFDIVWITGWAPHESQPKPLAPGSARMRLAEALGTTERKL